MFTVHVTPLNSDTRREVGRFDNEDVARACAEKKLKGYRFGLAEVINEHDGGFPCSTIYIGRAV